MKAVGYFETSGTLTQRYSVTSQKTCNLNSASVTSHNLTSPTES